MAQPARVGVSPLVLGMPACSACVLPPPFAAGCPLWLPAPAVIVPSPAAPAVVPDEAPAAPVGLPVASLLLPHALPSRSNDNTAAPRPIALERISTKCHGRFALPIPRCGMRGNRARKKPDHDQHGQP